jgi:hypothetical protein
VTTDGAPEGGQESGGALRDNLEATLADNKALREVLVTEVTSNFQHVKAEDLAGVAPSELKERAAAIEAQRIQDRQALVSAELKSKGWTDQQVEEFLATPGTPPPSTPKPKFDGNVGTPPARPKPGDEDGLYGPSRIRAALGE